MAAVAQPGDVVDQHDAVVDHHADQQDQPDDAQEVDVQPEHEVAPVDPEAGQRDGQDDRQRQDEALEQEAHQQVDEDDRHHAREQHRLQVLAQAGVAISAAPGHALGQLDQLGERHQPSLGLLLTPLLELESDLSRGPLVLAEDALGRGDVARLGQRGELDERAVVGGHPEIVELVEGVAIVLPEPDHHRNLLAVAVVARQRLPAQGVADDR